MTDRVRSGNSPSRLRKDISAALVTALAYVVTARAGLLLDPVGGFAAFVWAPTGIAIAAAVVIGRAAAPAVFVGAFVANLLTDASPLVAAAIGVGNTLEAMAGAWILRRFGFHSAFEKVRDASLFLMVAAVVPVLSASIGVAALRVAGVLTSGQVGFAWLAWWVGDAIGALIFAPLILVWLPPAARRFAPGQRPELALIMAVLTIATGTVFLAGPTEPRSFLETYLIFPFLLWATVKFQQRGATLSVFLVAFVAIIGTINSTGPFVQGALAPSLFALQTFMGIVAATLLVLATALAERGSARRIAEEQAVQHVAQLSERNAQLLAQAGAVLASSLDYNVTLERLSQLVVPGLGDWCAVDTRNDAGQLRRVAVAHPDPSRLRLARELETRYPTDLNASTGAPRVFRTGEAALYEDVSDAMLVAAARDAEHLKILRELGLRSAMVVPIVARDRVDGVLTLVSSESGRRYSAADLELAKELGRRAGLAIENSLLLAESRAAADRMARLQAVTSRLASVLRPDEIGNTVLAEGIDALRARHAALCVMTSGGAALEIISSIGIPEDVVRHFQRFAIDAPLPLSEAVRTSSGVFLEDRAAIVGRFPDLREANSRATTEAWIALPLVIGNRTIGGVAFGFAEARRFDQHDRGFAVSLAHQAALAMERTRLYAAEQDARAEAETANRAKSEFLATMSHELRTPLNAVAGYTQLLEMGLHGDLSAQQRESIERIGRSAAQLRGLIEDVLSFSRIEAGHVEVSTAAVPVRDVIRDVETLLAPQLRAKAQTLSFTNCDAGLTAHADAEKVRQILINLVANAVKFTPAGGSITISGEVMDGRVAIQVRDTGVGIPHDKHEVIFEPFVQLGRSLRSPQEGSGLGLAISRRFARAMNGDLTVESELGSGSTFTLTLPAAGA